MNFKILTREEAVKFGFSDDIRKRRRQHLKKAKALLSQGGFFNDYSAPCTIFWCLAQWHKAQARGLN